MYWHCKEELRKELKKIEIKIERGMQVWITYIGKPCVKLLMPEVTRPQMPQTLQAYLYPSAKPSSRRDTDALFLF